MCYKLAAGMDGGAADLDILCERVIVIDNLLLC